MPDPHWQEARRILVVRLDSLGDVLMTTPAIRALRSGPRVAHVTLLTSPTGAEIARMVPEIDEVLVYEAPWMKAGAERGIGDDRAMIATLAEGNFDAAVIFTVWSQSSLPAAMLCRMAGIARILAHVRERVYRLISDAVPETEPESGIRHEVQRQLDLVATLGWHTSDERLSLAPARSDIPVPGARWAVVHPGSSAASRRYPIASFGAAMAALADRHGWRFLITGDRSERPLCAQIESAYARNLAGELTLPQLVALIADAPLLITNNTGPAHIAAAVQTPVVDLYAMTNPQHTPWMVPSRVLNFDVPCRWCLKSECPEGHHLCLTGVPPEAVVAAALDLTHTERHGGAAVLPSGVYHQELPTTLPDRAVDAPRALQVHAA